MLLQSLGHAQSRMKCKRHNTGYESVARYWCMQQQSTHDQLGTLLQKPLLGVFNLLLLHGICPVSIVTGRV